MDKKKIALVTGGYSGEAVISYKSAKTIYHHLDKELFDVYTIDITPTDWFYEDENGNRISVDKNDFSITTSEGKITFDAVFIGLHGTPGEDGKLQGYFDMLGLPYTSCNAATSALTFNKRYTTAVAGMSGIHVAKSVLLFKQQDYETDSLLAQLQLPLFVKPNNGGSSIGMSKVTEAGQLQPALEKAFGEDDQVLIEEMVIGREFTVGVFKSGKQITVLPITEVSTHKEFFDFEAKYGGQSSETTPAQMEPRWQEQVEATAEKIYRLFNCNGVVRIDFIYNPTVQAPFMLEINTIPGQSEASIIPQQVKVKGWSLQEFYTLLVQDALHNSTVGATV
ncbi:MAG: D-alanine--D-alanine ligase [Flavisolibacter sp.]|nr:D-alanine--D-alanine ligase [Flavisolibacter sp.]MBD0288972.1 D-alanine--D-alanine ligase [Flavisolibacter sp.]